MGLWSGGGGGAVGFPVETQIRSSAKSQMEELKDLPGTVSAESVTQEAGEAAKAEMRSMLVAAMVKNRLRRLNAMAATYGHHATFQKGLLNIAIRTGRTDADFMRSVGMYQIGAGENQARFNGYQNALQGVDSLI